MVNENQKNGRYPHLSGINTPADLKNMPCDNIKSLCSEIREFLIECVLENGGHLASNLGAVEATIAIHRVFSSPHDHIIFDVGHQSYTHKLITGRREEFDTLRHGGGISGFPKRDESEHDAFGTGHSSTSLSAALGFAEADRLSGSDAYTVCVFGDGAFTGGMIHEALNNCRRDLRLVMILNDNEVTNTAKMESFCQAIGIDYYGPVDGNDEFATEALLQKAKESKKCCLVHLHTQKGKGYVPAEENPDRYHAVHPAFAVCSSGNSFSEEMGSYLTEFAKKDEKICAMTAAMTSGTGLSSFQSTHPERFFDVGIAEPHAVTFAAGLAAGGYRPVVAIYSSFLQRAYDNIIHDVALQNLPVVFCIDRAGLNSADGATHHGIFDVAFLSQIPNVSIYTPVTNEALRSVMDEALQSATPAAIRYPNGCEDAAIVQAFYSQSANVFGRVRADYAENDAQNLDAVIVTHGRIVTEAIKAKEVLKERGKNVGVLLLEQIKPYDKIAEAVAHLLPEQASRVLFLEEEIRTGGMGMNLSSALSVHEVMKNKTVTIKALGDHFAIQTQNEPIWKSFGLDCDSIVCDILC
ncbi:MAG: 1-deoxy-D-xylulose-5-phosphate synthase [Clostridia bacterium]|nr:1-deoxy-D-xylulose-5-phosphate synthase [Clostridia bacterium]